MFDETEIIDKLKLELKILEKGGYAPSIQGPHRTPRVFRDSVSCPNLGLEFKVEPCSNCYLMHFVPPEHRDKENPCHYIPLNKQGDTVASLSRQQDGEALHTALRSWLQKTMFRLAEERESPRLRRAGRPGLLLSPGDRRPCLLQPTEDQTSSSCTVARRG